MTTEATSETQEPQAASSTAPYLGDIIDGHLWRYMSGRSNKRSDETPRRAALTNGISPGKTKDSARGEGLNTTKLPGSKARLMHRWDINHSWAAFEKFTSSESSTPVFARDTHGVQGQPLFKHQSLKAAWRPGAPPHARSLWSFTTTRERKEV